MQFFQYQNRAEVPQPGDAAETTTVDRWQPTFSQPIRRAFAVAAIVAGVTSVPPMPAAAESMGSGGTTFGWLITANPLFQYQARADVPQIVAETVTVDRWQPTYSGPIPRPKNRLEGYSVESLLPVAETPAVSGSSSFGWQLSPCPLFQYQAHANAPQGDSERTTVDRWQPTYSGPIPPRLNRPEGCSTGSLQPTAQEQWQPTYSGPIPARQNRPEGYLVGSPFPVAPPPSFDWFVVQPQPRPTTPRLLARQAGYSASVLTTDPGVSGLVYDLFVGDDLGGPIDYTTPVLTTTALAADLPPLALGSRKRIGVRARNLLIGWDDGNTDAWVEILLDGAGNDVTARPFPPGHLSATAVAGDSVVLYWSYPWLDASVLATGFHVYQGTAGVVSYASPVATVLNGPPVVPGNRWFKATISGLVDGTTYVFSVRAYNAVGEEDNTIAVSATAVSTAPGSVTSLGGMVSS